MYIYTAFRRFMYVDTFIKIRHGNQNSQDVKNTAAWGWAWGSIGGNAAQLIWTWRCTSRQIFRILKYHYLKYYLKTNKFTLFLQWYTKKCEWSHRCCRRYKLKYLNANMQQKHRNIQCIHDAPVYFHSLGLISVKPWAAIPATYNT